MAGGSKRRTRRLPHGDSAASARWYRVPPGTCQKARPVRTPHARRPRSVLTAVGARRAVHSGQGRRPESDHESDARVRRLECPARGARANIQT
jgi:hypothetical protein